MKTLIAYYSFTQNNEKLAGYLQSLLHCDIVKLETTKKRTGFSIMLDLLLGRKPALKPVPYYLPDYDHVVFCAPIWAGKIATPLKSFLVNEKSNIRRYSFITVCGGNPGQKEMVEQELISLLDKRPQKVVELRVNNLLPADQKHAEKPALKLKIKFDNVEEQLRNFIQTGDLVAVSR